MKVTISVTAGPHLGKEFVFEGHDTFLVGRSRDAHFQLSFDDPYFSRRHFLIEINPPRCRVLDLKSRNGIRVNGERVEVADLKGADELRAGHTAFRVSVSSPEPDDAQVTVTHAIPSQGIDLPGENTIDYKERLFVLPGYRVLRKLAQGGMGVVYQAIRDTDGREVAVKTILPGPGVTQKQVQRFLRETSILRSLQHPNIVEFLDCGESDEGLFLVMELVSGSDAVQLVEQKGTLHIAIAIRLMCQVLSGLIHAHQKGFVHRDIKPNNVLIGGKKGQRLAKLADFGLARAYETSRLSGVTLQGEIGGTPAFMAPEQVTHYRDVKPAADQYSAAATLYALLTGRGVHDLPMDVNRQLIHIMTEPAIPIRQRRPDLPVGLAAIIDKALSREPDDRYADVGGFRKALKAFC